VTSYTIGVDLGQSTDYTALGIVERFRRPTGKILHWFRDPDWPVPQTEDVFHLVHLERFELGTAYPAIVDHVCDLMGRHPLTGLTELVLDATGVGRPVVDMFNQRKPDGRRPVPITITGGDKPDGMRMPKRDLAMCLQVLLQTERLKIAKSLPLAEVLMREMLAFRVKINLQTGHDSYEAWRERDHDDLVLACYWKHNRGRPQWLDPLPAAEATL
jgi:hypothetical protein